MPLSETRAFTTNFHVMRQDISVIPINCARSLPLSLRTRKVHTIICASVLRERERKRDYYTTAVRISHSYSREREFNTAGARYRCD